MYIQLLNVYKKRDQQSCLKCCIKMRRENNKVVSKIVLKWLLKYHYSYF